MTFHFKLLELESELLAKELANQNFDLTPECFILLEYMEQEIGMRLGDRAPKDWRGWISYRSHNNSLVILRGRSFTDGAQRYKSGFDINHGADTISEYVRGFDVTPPQELDHLLINFRAGDCPEVLLWYGENIAPYQLYYKAEVSNDIEIELNNAVIEGCTWILTKPKDITLAQFLKKKTKA